MSGTERMFTFGGTAGVNIDLNNDPELYQFLDEKLTIEPYIKYIYNGFMIEINLSTREIFIGVGTGPQGLDGGSEVKYNFYRDSLFATPLGR